MKATDWAWVAIAVGVMLLGTQGAFAHGCEGDFACAQNPQHQWQQEQQQQTQGQAATGGAASVTNASRSWSVRPVQPVVPPAITPSATVSRYADTECQPRMKIVRRSVNGLNNRPMGAQEFEAGTDMYVVSDEEMPYKRVELAPGLVRFFGHRMTETTAVTTVSTGWGFGIGGNGSNGAGGSIGAGASGGLQRLITTIRLMDCVAYELDTRTPPKPEVVEKVKWRTRTVEKVVPVIPCMTCMEKK